MLFNWMWHQGMLKGADERDMVATLEFQAKGGTIQVDGQPCTLSKFRESTNFQTFSQVAFAFAVTPWLLTQGLAYALIMAFFGALLPALKAARLPIASALREL